MTRFVPSRTGARPAAAAALALLGALLTVGVTATPAAALAVESASPAPGSTSASAPTEVRMRFDDLVFITDFDLSVTGPRGDVKNGIPVVFGRDVTQRLDDDLPNGRYTVSWRVEGSLLRQSGSGSFTFRVGAARPPGDAAAVPPGRPTTAPSASASADPKPTRLANPVATTGKPARGVPIAGAEPTVNVPQPEVAGVATTSAEWLPPPVAWWAAFGVAGAGALVWRRRRRNRPAPQADAMPEPLLRQTELVLGAGPGLTAPDGPPPMSLTPTQGVPRLSVVPSPASPGTYDADPSDAAGMFTPHTPPVSIPRLDFGPGSDPLTDPLPPEALEPLEPLEALEPLQPLEPERVLRPLR